MNLYVLNHCNEKHERASFRLLGVVKAQSLDSAIKVIKHRYNYSDEDIERYIDITYVALDYIDVDSI